jgi:hypothetical protein
MPGAQPIEGERGLFLRSMACRGGESGAELEGIIAVSSIVQGLSAKRSLQRSSCRVLHSARRAAQCMFHEPDSAYLATSMNASAQLKSTSTTLSTRCMPAYSQQFPGYLCSCLCS